jgi:sugar phosphate isomerase/epimerase
MTKIACQTIIYGETVKDNIERILEEVGDIGYDGVEIAIRHFHIDRPDFYKELLAKNNLTMPAIHMGGNFLDKDSVKEQLDNYEKTLQFAKTLGCSYIYLSGSIHPDKSVEDYKNECAIYNRMSEQCFQSGMKLCYHNHDWEMVNKQAGMNILLAETDPEKFFFVPDVGWMTVANVDPAAFIEQHHNRIAALHFKEFAPIRTFSELGTGYVDFPSVYEKFKKYRKDFWVSAEQDRTRKLPKESAMENYNYIKNLCKD